VPHVVPCFASLWVSRIDLALPPYLGSAQGSRTLFARFRSLFAPTSSAPSPEARPATQRAPFDVRWPVVRDTSRPTLCSSPILFSKTSTRVACDYRSAFEVTFVHSGELPGSRPATRFNRLTVCSQDLLFPSAHASTDFLAPRHRHLGTRRTTSDDLACSRERTLVKSASFPQTKVPSVDSHPKTGLVGCPKASLQPRGATW